MHEDHGQLEQASELQNTYSGKVATHLIPLSATEENWVPQRAIRCHWGQLGALKFHNRSHSKSNCVSKLSVDSAEHDMISTANKKQKYYKCICNIYNELLKSTLVNFSCWASCACSYECWMQNGWTKVTAVLCFPLCDSGQCRCTAWSRRWDWELCSLCSWREWTGIGIFSDSLEVMLHSYCKLSVTHFLL